MSGAPVKASDLLLLPAGFIVWSSAFVCLYGLSGLGCALGWDRPLAGPLSSLRIGLIAVWLLHVAAACWLVRGAARRRVAGNGLFGNGSFVLSIAALVATVGTGAPTLVLSLCR